MPIPIRTSAVSLIKTVKGLISKTLKATVSRKVPGTGGIEPGWTVSAIYRNIDCAVQPVSKKDMEQLQFAPAGLIGLFTKVGYVPRYQKISGSDSPEELVLLEDDKFEVTVSSDVTEKYWIKNLGKYDTHYELLLEQIKE